MLQTIRDHRAASSVTREEFEDIMRAVKVKVKQLIRARGESWVPLYSWDHPSFHEDIDYARVGIREDQRVQLV